MVLIRPDVLRRYHETTFGGRPALPEAFTGATFDEYVGLCRCQFPKISAWRAATHAPIAAFQEQAAELEPDAQKQPSMPVFAALERQAEVELGQALKEITPGVERLLLNRLKSVKGWAALATLSSLDDLEVGLCASPHGQAARPPIELRRVGITSCSRDCIRLVLGSTRAREVAIAYPRTSAFNCEALASHGDLEDLSLHAPLVLHVEHLAALPLRVLRLGMVEPDAALVRLLTSLAPTLEELNLSGTRPLGPEALPELPALKRLLVPGYEESRQGWIDFAVDHPEVGCFFPAYRKPSASTASVSVHEIYRGVDILRSIKGKKTSYEIALDLASEMAGFQGDNGDLEDELKRRARASKIRGLKWSSEADNLVAMSSTPDALRWVIDTASEFSPDEGPRCA